jgi:hypothetical protein
MSNLRDFHNLPITTDSDVAAEAFNRAIASYLNYRIDIPDHLKATLEADPEHERRACIIRAGQTPTDQTLIGAKLLDE